MAEHDDERDTLLDSIREEKNQGGQNQDEQHDDQADDQEQDDQQDDQQDDADDADHGDEDDAQPQRQSRGSQRIRDLARREREAREEREAARREAAELRARLDERERISTTGNAAREAEEERTAMSAMSDAERAQYLMAKKLKQLEGGFGQLHRQTQDSTDRAQFDALLARSGKRFEKYREKVEQLAQQAAREGGFLAREIILDTLVGRDIRTNGVADTQRREARDRIEGERGRSRTARSDAPGDRGGNKGKLSHVQRMEKADPII